MITPNTEIAAASARTTARREIKHPPTLRYVFVTGMGRSGTTWFAHLLDGIPGVKAYHEHIGDKWFTVLSRYIESDHHSVPYLERSRTALESSHQAGTTFVDVNNNLRYSVPALKKVFEGCTIFHLVRDPRAVVPSLYLRRGDSVAHSFPTAAEDIQWLLDADKFEQVCWTWADTTKLLMEQGTELLQFERLLTDYDYLAERFLEPTGLALSRDEWTAKKDTRVNETRSKLFRYAYAKLRNKNFVEDQLPRYQQWSDSQKRTFDKICGDVRRQVGYD